MSTTWKVPPKGLGVTGLGLNLPPHPLFLLPGPPSSASPGTHPALQAQLLELTRISLPHPESRVLSLGLPWISPRHRGLPSLLPPWKCSTLHDPLFFPSSVPALFLVPLLAQPCWDSNSPVLAELCFPKRMLSGRLCCGWEINPTLRSAAPGNYWKWRDCQEEREWQNSNFGLQNSRERAVGAWLSPREAPSLRAKPKS